jgi:hypothetical protein
LQQQEDPQGPPPIPRTLLNARDVRRELVSLYKQTKRYQIDPQTAGRLTHILNSITAMDQGVLVDQRLTEIEERLGTIKANGSARPEARP